MTTKELLEKAKAVGGWYINRNGRIRTRNKKCGREFACPIVAVCGGSNRDPAPAARSAGYTGQIYPIILAADAKRDLQGYDAVLRKEMESWCK